MLLSRWLPKKGKIYSTMCVCVSLQALYSAYWLAIVIKARSQLVSRWLAVIDFPVAPVVLAIKCVENLMQLNAGLD